MWKSPGHAFLASMLVPLVFACSSTPPEEPGNTGGTPGSAGQGGSSTAQPDAGPGGTGGGGDTGGSGGNTGGGGSTGSGGGSATGGAGGAGDGVSCKPLTNGCTCAEVPPDPDAVKACTATSVADKPGSKGTCCKGGGLCKCEAFACVQDSNSNFCSCGRASSTTSVLKGPIVPDCSGAVARNPLKVKCCKSPDRCTCRESDCLAGIDEEVPNCSVSDVARCDSGQTAVLACKS